MVNRMLEKIYGFWFKKRPGTSLGLLRILFGVMVLVTFGSDMFQIIRLYGNDGLLPSETIPSFEWVRFSPLEHVQNPLLIYLAYFLLLVVAFLFTIGYKTRYVGIVQFILILSFHERNLLILNGGDTFLRIMSFFIMFSPCGQALSIDSLSKGKPKAVSIWSVRVIQIYVCMVYFFSGLVKLFHQPWVEGNALSFVLRTEVINRFNVDWITSMPFFLSLLTWFFLFSQLSFCVFIWFRIFRKPLLLTGAFMHLGIFIFLDVGWFGLQFLVSYAVFLKHEEILGVVHRIRHWLFRFRTLLFCRKS